MDLDDKHHVIQLNKLKFKQNNQIDRLVKAVETQFADSNKGLDESENSFTKVSSILNSKFSSKYFLPSEVLLALLMVFYILVILCFAGILRTNNI